MQLGKPKYLRVDRQSNLLSTDPSIRTEFEAFNDSVGAMLKTTAPGTATVLDSAEVHVGVGIGTSSRVSDEWVVLCVPIGRADKKVVVEYKRSEVEHIKCEAYKAVYDLWLSDGTR